MHTAFLNDVINDTFLQGDPSDNPADVGQVVFKAQVICLSFAHPFTLRTNQKAG